MKALLIGATGATGKDLLQLLLKDREINQVEIFVRRDIAISHEKLTTHIIDFDKPEEWKHLVKGDILFSCLGTTLKAAGNIEAQRKVDYTYQLEFAKAAKQNNVATYVLVSSAGASSTSPFAYPKMKGELEEQVKLLKFPKLIIFNPPILERKGSDRKAEVLGAKIIRSLNSVGILKSMKPLKTEVLAQAMLNAVKTKTEGEYRIKGQEILNYV